MKTFVVKKTVVCATYCHIQAKNIEQARKIAQKLEQEGNLNVILGPEQWEEVIGIEVAEDFINGEPVGEVLEVEKL